MKYLRKLTKPCKRAPLTSGLAPTGDWGFSYIYSCRDIIELTSNKKTILHIDNIQHIKYNCQKRSGANETILR